MKLKTSCELSNSLQKYYELVMFLWLSKLFRIPNYYKIKPNKLIYLRFNLSSHRPYWNLQASCCVLGSFGVKLRSEFLLSAWKRSSETVNDWQSDKEASSLGMIRLNGQLSLDWINSVKDE